MDDDVLDTQSKKITLSKSTFNILIIGVIVASVGFSFLIGFMVGTETAYPEKIFIQDAKNVIDPQSVQSSAQSSTQKQTTPILVSVDDDPMRGDPNAPITMIEFSDFQCPFCLKFHTQTLALIQKDYIDTGKVNFVYRDFPIQAIHPNAVPAALAAECADDQGMFWEYHDNLFDNQQNWGGLATASAVNTFKQYAAELGLDAVEFDACLDSGKYVDEIRNDLQAGQSYGVTGTPGFFIGNDKIGYVNVSGAQPYSVFERVIDQLLTIS